jgi:hypothetical protein
VTKSGVLFMVVLFVIVSIGPSVLAQPGSPDCPVIPEDILTSLDSVCAGLERNTACYGYSHRHLCRQPLTISRR